MYILVLPRIPCLRFMNRLNSLKHAQHFGAHNSHQKKGMLNASRNEASKPILNFIL